MKQSISKLAIYTVVGLWALTSIPSQAAPVSSKILERIEFNETSLETAIEYLRQRSQELDPTGQGINFIFSEEVDREAPVTLLLRDVPLGVALSYTIEMAGASYKVDRYAVRITSDVLAGSPSLTSPSPRTSKKVQELYLESIEMESVSLAAAVDYFSARSATLDPKGTGINILIHPTVDRDRLFTLRMTGISFSTALRYMTELTNTQVRFDRHAIVIMPPEKTGPQLAMAY